MFQYIIHACIMLSLGRIPISAHVVANPSGMILLYLAAPFFTPKVFLYRIFFTQTDWHIFPCLYALFCMHGLTT